MNSRTSCVLCCRLVGGRGSSSGVRAADEGSGRERSRGRFALRIPGESSGDRRPCAAVELEACGHRARRRGAWRSRPIRLSSPPPRRCCARIKGTLWDSGKVASDQSLHVAYAGKPLVSHAACWWKVRVWDQDGKVSHGARPRDGAWACSMPADWSARWIGWDGGEETDEPFMRRCRPPRGSGTRGAKPRSVRRSGRVIFGGR